jgi:three-Cys-motif partner protein
MGISFENLRTLAVGRSIDFLCLLASRTDAGRNPHNYPKEENTKVEELLGLSNWRQLWDEAKQGVAKQPNLGDFICELFAKQMETLGYLPTPLHEMKPIKRDDGGTLYHLALFARHERAKHFWKQATEYSQPQRTLNF